MYLTIFMYMRSDLLIIADTLVEPPSETSAFRTVTMFCHDNFEMEILFHTSQELKDLYYHWMKPRGLLDFISYMINETEWEDGIRLDTLTCYPDTIVIRAIRLDNQLSILGKIKSLTGK